MRKRLKNIIYYTLFLAVFGTLIGVVIKMGEARQPASTTVFRNILSGDFHSGLSGFISHLVHEIESPVTMFLLQIIVILFICRLFAYGFMKMGQPTVLGEILAGIVLGPSILGNIFPDVFSFLFKEESLGMINTVSAIGLVLFMFAIGMELDLNEIRKKLKVTVLISHTSIILPFFLGTLAAFYAYDLYAWEGTPFYSFALFVGISMSITAFPVLARIIQERKMTRTHLGGMALACAANGDITAWCLLALVVAIAQAGTMLSAVFTIVLAGVYLCAMLIPVRRFLRMFGEYYNEEEGIDKWMVALLFLILTTSACITQALGLHALFGAFIAGLIMPENLKFRRIMTEKVEDVSLTLFLPLFFVSTGLRTEIGLLNTPALWIMCGAIILAAVAGKVGGTYIAARIAGENVRNSLFLGALMNTRGLMELIVLTIGYEMKILSPPIFVALVIMTLVTTFMTGPLLAFLKFCFRKKDEREVQATHRRTGASFQLLLSFAQSKKGEPLLNLAQQMFSRGDKKLEITALHLTVGTEVNPLHAEDFESLSFGPLLYEASKLNISVRTHYDLTNDVGTEIVNIVKKGKYDFLLIGAGSSISAPVSKAKRRQGWNFLPGWSAVSETFLDPTAILKDKTRYFADHAECPVGIFVERNYVKPANILLLLANPDDLFLLEYLRPLLQSTLGRVAILRFESMDIREDFLDGFQSFSEQISQSRILPQDRITAETFIPYNFMLISYGTWNLLAERDASTLKRVPSTLIIRS
jgi:Kef-type K+ transport system membrane component KefB